MATSVKNSTQQEGDQPKGILDRVNAFVNLKFPPTIEEMAFIRDQTQIAGVEREALLELVEFFLDQMDYEDSVHFLQASFQTLRRNKLMKEGTDPGPLQNEPDVTKLIPFKPCHDSFRKLQDSYLDSRLYLTNLIMKSKSRFDEIQRELEAEQKQFQAMCDQFVKKDGKLTDQVIEDSVATNVAANTRKGQIMRLFSEVQQTQMTLNQNLLAELKIQIEEQTTILGAINASVSEFVDRINKAINLKLEQVQLAARNTLRIDDCPDCSIKLDDFQPTYIKYVGSKLILAWGYKLQGHANQLVWEDSHQVYFFSSDDLRLIATVSCKSKSVKVFSAVGSNKDIYVALERKILIFGKADLKLKKQINMEHQPTYLDEDGKKAIVGCAEGTVNYILFDSNSKAQEKQLFSVDIAKIMFSRDSKKFALCDKSRDLITQFDRDHWLQFSILDGTFEIKNPETGQIIPVQLDHLDRFQYNADSASQTAQNQLVEMQAHPLFWHDSSQYLVVRDEDDRVNLTRVKVQMDMAVANTLNQTDANPEGTRKTNFVPQDGKFMDVYAGPNQSLIILGVTAKGTLWKKELYKGFFDIFDN